MCKTDFMKTQIQQIQKEKIRWQMHDLPAEMRE